MPLPSKNNKESKDKFMDRCISDKTMKKEFPKIKQRIAVCMNKYQENKKS
tara:strand:- start:708 stop:857 length:150 start_codon:yes stop_codon:yes gene_type:complete